MPVDRSDLRPAGPPDRAWIAEMTKPVGGPIVVSGGALHDLRDRPGLVALEHRGLILWHDADNTREILALVAAPQGQGTGLLLLQAATLDAKARGLTRAILDTTDDNSRAIRFYERNGFAVEDIVKDGFAEVLLLKNLPADPVMGQHGQPIRDILRFAKTL